MAKNVTKIFFHQKPEFKKWAEAQGWIQVITKSTTHAEIFLSCLIRLAPDMTPFIKVLIEQLAQIEVVQCCKCNKIGKLKLSLYKAKKNTDEWVWFKNDLICKDCFDCSGKQIVDILKQCDLIKKLNVPYDVVMIIGDLSKGMIVECVLCGKMGNVSRRKFKSRKNTKKWKFCDNYTCEYDAEDMVCNKCFRRCLCTLCQENIDDKNYKCNTCQNVICGECEKMKRHRELHHEMSVLTHSNHFTLIMTLCIIVKIRLIEIKTCTQDIYNIIYKRKSKQKNHYIRVNLLWYMDI